MQDLMASCTVLYLYSPTSVASYTFSIQYQTCCERELNFLEMVINLMQWILGNIICTRVKEESKKEAPKCELTLKK